MNFKSSSDCNIRLFGLCLNSFLCPFGDSFMQNFYSTFEVLVMAGLGALFFFRYIIVKVLYLAL